MTVGWARVPLLCLLVVWLLTAGALSAVADDPTGLSGRMTVGSAGDANLEKLHPRPREMLGAVAPGETLHVILRVQAGPDLAPYLHVPLERPFSDERTITTWVRTTWPRA
jgi:hypothetical protein